MAVPVHTSRRFARAHPTFIPIRPTSYHSLQQNSCTDLYTFIPLPIRAGRRVSIDILPRPKTFLLGFLYVGFFKLAFVESEVGEETYRGVTMGTITNIGDWLIRDTWSCCNFTVDIVCVLALVVDNMKTVPPVILLKI